MPYIHFLVTHVARNQYVAFMTSFLRTQALQEMCECIHVIHYKTGFHKKLITSQKHTGRVCESTGQHSNTFSAGIHVLDFMGHLVEEKSPFRFVTFPFSKRTM